MKFLMLTVLAQIDDDASLPTVPADWPEKSYWVADVFNNAEHVDKVMGSARISMSRKITQDGMPGC